MRHCISMGGLVCAVALFGTTAHVQAQDRGVAFGGVEAGGQPSAYAGASLALPGSALGRGWAVRGLASVGRYEYDSGGLQVDADYVQADLVLLNQRSGSWGYLNLGAGVRFTDTDLSPSDPGNEREGRHWDGVVTADAVRNLGAWQVGGYGVYGVRMREYFVRAEVSRSVGARGVRLGAEVTADGDEAYSRSGAGLVGLYSPPGGRYGIRGALGAREGGDAYVSIGLTRTF